MFKLVNIMLFSAVLTNLCDSPQSPLYLKNNANGQQFTISPGQEIIISLEANPTTGYTWEITEIDNTLLKQLEEIKYTANSEMLGSSGKQTIHLQGLQHGQTKITLIYHRPWEKDTAPLKTFSVNLKIER